MDNINNREYLEEVCKEKIIDRYTKTDKTKLCEFVINKIAMQWCIGDYNGAYWSQDKLNPRDYKIDIYNKGNVWYQLFHIILLLMVFVGLFNKKEYIQNNMINLFYIIFCGYGCTFLILESQARYGFIIYWVFVILALCSVSFINCSKNLKYVFEKINNKNIK